MRNILKTIELGLTLALGYAIVYLIGSIIVGNFAIMNWSDGSRYTVSGLMLGWTFLCGWAVGQN